MRFLFFTDTHIRGNSPANRKDNFPDTLEKKFNEIADMVRHEEVDYVLCGGDLFDNPMPTIPVVTRYLGILRSMDVPIYAVAGNHDMYGHNPETLDRTMMGFLNSMDIITLIRPGQKIMLEKDGIRAQLTGQEFTYNLDDGTGEGYIVREKEADVAIHMVHGFLTDVRLFEGARYTTIDRIAETKADITLAGHNHAGFKDVIDGGRYIINPGGLARVTNHLSEIQRMPQVVIIELEGKITIRKEKLKTAKKGEEVLDRTALEATHMHREKLEEFAREIRSSGMNRAINITDIINEIVKNQNLNSAIKEEALRRIAMAQETGGADK
ncbi:MAG: metallophosphoesterase family protein [Thermoanaerobacteraceae bacterium]|nr:metallophosphoesterase family protein [Thermoanaerobacteraceae bacterium]